MSSSFMPPNILVVDDVNTNLAVMTELIRNAGYVARPVLSARQAVSAIEAMLPNLILLDISMPEIDGYTFCSMLKKSVKTRDIPVIFVTALSTVQDRVKGLQVGAADFITKPFDEEELKLRISIHLKMNKIQQELEIYNKKLSKIINDQIHKIYDEQKNLMIGLTNLLEKRYNEKAIHMSRIGKNSRILALSLQLSPQYRDQITNSFIEAIEFAAPLHDIGIIGLSDSILHKSEALDENEINIMRSHTVIGAETLEEIYSLSENNDLLKMAIDIAKYHHENWDGTGYPAGINGTDIPLCARITSVVDTYDNAIIVPSSMTSYPHEKRMELINNGAGTKFDPDIVSIFNKIQNQLVK